MAAIDASRAPRSPTYYFSVYTFWRPAMVPTRDRRRVVDTKFADALCQTSLAAEGSGNISAAVPKGIAASEKGSQVKVHYIDVTGLNGRLTGRYAFHSDLSVITGLNGSGKTTLLKLTWYLISANVERVLREMTYERIEISTNAFHLELTKSDEHVRWEFRAQPDGTITRGEYLAAWDNDGSEEINRLIMHLDLQSVYFPTFRRIEGGYSIDTSTRHSGNGRFFRPGDSDRVQDELDRLSERLSVRRHKFVASISTSDIVSLLTSRYTEISEKLNAHYKDFTTRIIGEIRQAKQTGASDVAAGSQNLLNDIQNRADKINSLSRRILAPFTTLSSITGGLFKHRGISAHSVTLGESVDAIDSDSLSAGEKQMLSFLCYNAFATDAVIFIDEPELSLHPDWQRRIFPILLKQQPSNQFIIATHSPFIYSKYEDKDIMLGGSRGE